MRKVTAQRLAEFTERDYVLTFGVGKREFDRMLAALEDAYRREHKRKPRFTKITMLDKLVLTLIYRHEYRSMDSIAAEYEVSRDTIEVNVHWVGADPAERRSNPEKRYLCVQNQLKQAPAQNPKILCRSFFTYWRSLRAFWPECTTVHLEFWAEE